MKKIATRFGLFALASIILLSSFHLLSLNWWKDYNSQEVIGYLVMFLSMIFVFLGIRLFRDKYQGGYLRFGQGLKLGTLITLLPAVGFGLLDILYTRVINPNWSAEYKDHMRQEILKNHTGAEAAAKQAEMEQMMDLFSNPLVEFLLMGGTVFIIGFIVSIISALALQRKPLPSIA